MKISIITIQYAHNYGAVLQAFSLKKFLEECGHQVTIVNYIPQQEKKKYSLKLKNPLGKKEAITKLKIVEWLRNEIDVKRAQPEWKVRYNHFNEFIETKLTLGKCEITEIEHLENDIDAFICGSDQIWNPVIVGEENPFFFLDFDTTAKKISYAASMGNPRNCYKKEYIQRVFSKFNAISVREEQLKELLTNYYGIESINIVCDPCLLLEKKDFVPLIAKNKLENSRYICTYYINDDGLLNDNFKNIVEFDEKQIIEIRWIRNFRVHNQNQKVSLSVSDFLWYIDNCEMLFTDSFHGVIFALLFHKDFWAVYETNSRIDSLLSTAGIEHRHIRNIKEAKHGYSINWEMVDRNIEHYREKSKKFLEQSLICEEYMFDDKRDIKR